MHIAHTLITYNETMVQLDEALLTLQEEFAEDNDLQDVFAEEKTSMDENDYESRLYGNY